MRVIRCEQASAEWYEARRGKITASRMHRILTPKTLKLSAQAEGLLCELIGELKSLVPPEGIENATTRAMRWGVETEAEARRFYSMERDVDVEQVGLCVSDCGRYTCSPDGLVGEDGGVEIKCPTAAVHVAYLLQGDVPADYLAQTHGSLIVTGRKWWDWISYHIGLPPLLIRIVPDDYTAKLAAALEEFHARYMVALARIEALGRKGATP